MGYHILPAIKSLRAVKLLNKFNVKQRRILYIPQEHVFAKQGPQGLPFLFTKTNYNAAHASPASPL